MEEKQLTSRELEEQANALLAEADFEEIKLPKKAKKAAAAKKANEDTAQAEKPAEKYPPLDEKLVASLPAAALLQGSEKLMEIFAKGKAKGKLSSSDLMETIDEMNLESEQLNQIYDSLETLGIDIGTAEAIDSSIDDVEPPMEEIAEIEEEELVDPNELVDSFSTDDPVRMYLKEIGKVSLLSADEEISLATAMSAGVEAKQKLEEAEKNGTELSEEEMKELKANPNRRAKGIVIEAKLDKGRGPVATVLVQNGTLRNGDTIIAGTAVGRVRAMKDDKGVSVSEAGPSVPVEIIGLSDVPTSGDEFNAVEDERMARELADKRRQKIREEELGANAKVSLDDLFAQISDGAKELKIIVKADVVGSAEAVRSSLEKLSNSEVKVRIIHSAVGGITEGDVMLAAASNAIIVGFNVRPDKNALDTADRQKVDIRTYRIIYQCIEEITAAMKGMLAPVFKEELLGHAEVRQTIRVPNVGTIAGCYILDGKVTRKGMVRVLRDSVVIFEDKIASLRRFKDDVKEVAEGYECGIGLEKFNDIKEGDILEVYEMVEQKA